MLVGSHQSVRARPLAEKSVQLLTVVGSYPLSQIGSGSGSKLSRDSCPFNWRLIQIMPSNSSGIAARIASSSDEPLLYRKFLRRDQEPISKGTVNTVICVTIILGVIFIAFALFVIYWMYMRSIDRRERKEQEKRDRLARLERTRKAKLASSGDSYTNERHNNYSGDKSNERFVKGSGRLRGKHQYVIWQNLAHRDYGADDPSRYPEPVSGYREPSISPTLHSSGTNRTEGRPELNAHSWNDPRGSGPKGIRRPPFESTRHGSVASLAASFSEEQSIDTRHIPFPPTSYQNTTRNERPGHMGFTPGLSPRRAPPRAGPSLDDTAPSTPHP